MVASKMKLNGRKEKGVFLNSLTVLETKKHGSFLKCAGLGLLAAEAISLSFKGEQSSP